MRWSSCSRYASDMPLNPRPECLLSRWLLRKHCDHTGCRIMGVFCAAAYVKKQPPTHKLKINQTAARDRLYPIAFNGFLKSGGRFNRLPPPPPRVGKSPLFGGFQAFFVCSLKTRQFCFPVESKLVRIKSLQPPKKMKKMSQRHKLNRERTLPRSRSCQDSHEQT